MYTEIECVEESIGNDQMIEMVERNRSQCEPHRYQGEAPAALTEKKKHANPKEAAHANSAGKC
jgi:hypothetical protein